MKAVIDCVHCYLKQSVSCMNMAGVDEDKQHEVLFKLMEDIKELDRNGTPCDNSAEIIFKTYEHIGINDPYAAVKKESNDLALSLYPRLKDIMNSSEDKLYTALKIAVAGNVIDLGIHRSFDIEGAIKQSMEKGFSVDHYKDFCAMLKETETVLILGDNTGEIVFDKILVEELQTLGKSVIYAVKSGPVLNDSTMEDAVYTGMDKLTEVVESGSRYLGTPMNRISPQFKKIVEEAPLIISKGQANYESVSEAEDIKHKVFFLLKIKCESVGRDADAPFNEMVFFRKGVRPM
jgi:damage-control phosphatase, subfamily I